MGSLPLHAAIVHIPLGIAVVVPWLALGLAIALVRGAVDKRSWAVVATLQAVVFFGGLAAMNTGEAEEEAVERVVDEQWIEEHEHRAEPFVWSAGLTLAVTVGVLLLGAERLAIGTGVAVLGMFVTLILAARVGHSGGLLVYEHGAASAYAAPKPIGDSH
jgi:hypothetical protein